jgi:hypothetical protein
MALSKPGASAIVPAWLYYALYGEPNIPVAVQRQTGKESPVDRNFLRVHRKRGQHTDWPPIPDLSPDLFDLITCFRARGDSFAIIVSIGFWMGDSPTKALTACELKLWYEGEPDRRAPKAAIR